MNTKNSKAYTKTENKLEPKWKIHKLLKTNKQDS